MDNGQGRQFRLVAQSFRLEESQAQEALSGNISSGPASGSLFSLDEPLSPNVAAALSLVGYNIVTLPDAFAGKHGVLDPEIIDLALTLDTAGEVVANPIT